MEKTLGKLAIYGNNRRPGSCWKIEIAWGHISCGDAENGQLIALKLLNGNTIPLYCSLIFVIVGIFFFLQILPLKFSEFFF